VTRRLLTLFAVVGAPLAWIGQLAFGYSFEEAACSPGDGYAVWGVGVRTMHAVVGSLALAVAVASLLAALAVRTNAAAGGLESDDRGFLSTFGVVGAALFALTIVLTGVGSTILATCHRG
jgi:hypothetical protein